MISPALKSKTSTPVQAELNQEFKKPPDVARALNFEAENSRQTRSKVDLKEVPIEELETQFQPPDITDDMYDVDNYLDDDFGQFLTETWYQPLTPKIRGLLGEEDHEVWYRISVIFI